MKIIVTGATGMVGSEVLRQAIADNNITEITAIVRRPLDVNHPKLRTIIHQNFSDYSDLADVFTNSEACIWCLGISQNQVNKEEYIKITYDYTAAFAKDILQANPGISFLFLSGAGADNTERSRFLFGRIKGRTENALMQMRFRKLYIARPEGILPVHKQKNLPFILKLQYRFVSVFKYITPSHVITSVDLAKALLYIIKNGGAEQLFHQAQLKQIAKKITP
jgi:uncharacterized protein YbjT (DUF2867 family)